MNETALLIELMEPTPIFEIAGQVARVVFSTITPVLLIVAIYIRVMETQLDQLAGNGRWAAALRDFLLWGTVLGLYFGIGSLIIAFMNEVYALVAKMGSLDMVTQQMERIIGQFQAKAAEQDSWTDYITDVAGAPYQLAATLVYYFSLIIVTFLAIFLRVAHAIGFGFAFIYGLIAIPLSITSNLKLLRGWAWLVGLVLMWPVAEGLCLALFAPLFEQAARALVDSPDINAAWGAGHARMLFTVLNLVVAAIMVAAPFVAGALISNSSAAMALLAPFVASATTAALATARVFEPARRGIGGLASGGSMGAAPGQGPRPRPYAPAEPGAIGSSRAPLSNNQRGARSELAGGESERETTPARHEETKRKRQARRGAILNQRKRQQQA